AALGDDVEVAAIVALPENHLSLAIDAAQQHGADDRQVLLLQAREYIEPAKRVLLRDAGTLRPALQQLVFRPLDGAVGILKQPRGREGREDAHVLENAGKPRLLPERAQQERPAVLLQAIVRLQQDSRAGAVDFID